MHGISLNGLNNTSIAPSSTPPTSHIATGSSNNTAMAAIIILTSTTWTSDVLVTTTYTILSNPGQLSSFVTTSDSVHITNQILGTTASSAVSSTVSASPSIQIPSSADFITSSLEPALAPTASVTIENPPIKPPSNNTAATTERPLTSTTSTALANAGLPDDTSSNGLAPSVVAGIGVACAVVGAVIAACFVFFLLRRRRRASAVQRERSDSYQDHSDTFSGTTAIAILEKPDSFPTSKDVVDLLPPATDFELQEDFTNLNACIRSYVETYCTASSELTSLAQDHSISAHNLDGLPELLSPSCPLSERQLDTLLKDPTTRLSAIRFLIAWNILSNVRPDAPLSSTLLPSEISRCIEALESIPLTGTITARPASPFRCPSPSFMRIVAETSSSSEEWLMSLHKWRQVTGAAMAAIYSDGVEQQLDFRDSRKKNVSELTASLIQVLQPFVVKGKGAARVKELERVVMRGAQVGWKIFVQGSTWSFGWERQSEAAFVVFPSLVKVGDDNGQRLGKPVVVAEMEAADMLHAMSL